MKLEKSILLLDIIIQTILVSIVLWYFIFIFLLNQSIANGSDIFLVGFVIPCYHFLGSNLPHYYFRKNMNDDVRNMRKLQLKVDILSVFLPLLILFILLLPYEDILLNPIFVLVAFLILLLCISILISTISNIRITLQDWKSI